MSTRPDYSDELTKGAKAKSRLRATSGTEVRKSSPSVTDARDCTCTDEALCEMIVLGVERGRSPLEKKNRWTRSGGTIG